MVKNIPVVLMSQATCGYSKSHKLSTAQWPHYGFIDYSGLCGTVEDVLRKPINDDSESSIICDSCLTWYHFQCANISTNPKRKIWFCRDCYADCRTDEFED